MSGRLADVGQRISTVRQLRAVVNAMRGIAGARAQQGRALLPAIRAYTATVTQAIGQAQHLAVPGSRHEKGSGKPGLILFGAEQGFAGSFPEQILDAAGDEFRTAHVFLVGERAAALARERNLPFAWQTRLPGRAAGLVDMAMEIMEALYGYLADAGSIPIGMIYPVWTVSQGPGIVRRSLLPLDPRVFATKVPGMSPLTNLPATDLIERLVQEYVFAQLSEAAVEAFSAENDARMATMAAAKTHIDGKLQALQLEERLTRQDEITAEVVELAAGARAARQRTTGV